MPELKPVEITLMADANSLPEGYGIAKTTLESAQSTIKTIMSGASTLAALITSYGEDAVWASVTSRYGQAQTDSLKAQEQALRQLWVAVCDIPYPPDEARAAWVAIQNAKLNPAPAEPAASDPAAPINEISVDMGVVSNAE